MEPIERFFWWMEERHRIFLKKDMGLSRNHWTDDEILKTYRFTNPFRENDKTTVWFREKMRNPLNGDDAVLMATVIFRWFNLIETGETLLANNLHVEWNPEIAREEIKRQSKYVTGGYIIKTPDGMDKVDGVIWCVNNIWPLRKTLADDIRSNNLRGSWNLFMQFPYLGAFMSYEIITDLRHTHFLNGANDI